MNIVIVGGNGLIGSKLVAILRERGYAATPVSRSTGFDVLTGEGLDEALRDAEVLVDVTNASSFADDDVLRFFQTSTRNLLRAAEDAGVRHYVALSVVGADRIPDSGYMRAKVAQEELIRSARVPYTVVRATQFYEFVGGIAASGVRGDEIHLPPALMQPIAAADVSAALADVAVADAADGVVEVAGPQKIPMDELIQTYLRATGDARSVIRDVNATYFGARVDDDSLRPLGAARLAPTRFEQWLDAQRTPVA